MASNTVPRHPIVWALASLMLLREVSARGMARRTGLTRQKVNEIMSGEREPTIAMLDTMARALGMELRIELETASEASHSGEVLTLQYARTR